MAERQKGGRSRGRRETRSPSESSERGRKSGGRKERLVGGGSEIDHHRRDRGHKSRIYSDHLETTSKVAEKKSRLSSCTSISTESEENSHYRRHHHHHHHHHQHGYEKKMTKKKKKSYSKKKLIADPRKLSGRSGLESVQQKHDSDISLIAGNKSTGNDHVTREDLLNETHAIEKEIRRGKHEILKISLRKERIELLHRNIHGTTLGHEVEGLGAGVAGGGGAGMCSDEVLRARLAELDEEIISEKQKLLRVTRRMEERNF